jgi:hypothetical protein
MIPYGESVIIESIIIESIIGGIVESSVFAENWIATRKRPAPPSDWGASSPLDLGDFSAVGFERCSALRARCPGCRPTKLL